ncbi:MAG: hypothetical protein M1365_11650 [Actinobacteria bacterium]|nr:hypothetical protein [Actinomycetota bacterium]
MAKIESRQPQTGMEEALAFSRKLPQIGLHPEIALRVGKSNLQTQEFAATLFPTLRAKIMQNQPNR